MEVVTGGSGAYSVIFWVALIVAVHAVLVFATLSGVLLDASILDELGVPKDVVTLGNSCIFFGWIPGAMFGGPLGDGIGRKPAALGFASLSGLGMCATGLVPTGAAAGPALLAARLATGVGLGGFVSPAFALLVESSDPRRAGRASVTWTWGYVGGVVLLCALHYGLFTLLGASWRTEELTLGAFILGSCAAVQVLVSESPRYLLASGKTEEAIEAAGDIARRNGVDLPSLLESDRELAPLRDALGGCLLAEESCVLDAAGAGGKPADVDAAEEQGCSDAMSACVSPAEEEVEWTDLFARDGGRLRLTLTLGSMEVAYNMAFYVIVFSAGALSDQLLLNLILLAAVDLPGSSLAGFAVDRVGAKKTAVAFLAVGGALLFAIVGYQAADVGAWLPLLPSTAVTASLSLLAKSMCTGAFTAIFLLFSECYPTKLRSAALGTGNMFGKLGAAAAAPLTAGVPLLSSLAIAGGLLGAAATVATTLPATVPSGAGADE